MLPKTNMHIILKLACNYLILCNKFISSAFRMFDSRYVNICLTVNLIIYNILIKDKNRSTLITH